MVKILLVEDDRSLREIYSVRLQAEGYEIVSAGDGEEGLSMAMSSVPDLIITDVMMPRVSGYDMLDMLRQNPHTKDTKVIMMTALSSESQKERGEALGVSRYLVKSQVGIEDIVNVVREVMGGNSSGVQENPQNYSPVNGLVDNNPIDQYSQQPALDPVADSGYSNATQVVNAYNSANSQESSTAAQMPTQVQTQEQQIPEYDPAVYTQNQTEEVADNGVRQMQDGQQAQNSDEYSSYGQQVYSDQQPTAGQTANYSQQMSAMLSGNPTQAMPTQNPTQVTTMQQSYQTTQQSVQQPSQSTYYQSQHSPQPMQGYVQTPQTQSGYHNDSNANPPYVPPASS